jgi:solute carrier family 35, member C2
MNERTPSTPTSHYESLVSNLSYRPGTTRYTQAFANAKDFYQDHCTYLPAMAGWFLFSALLSSYNKYVFGDKNLNFPCPLLLTSMHFLAQWVFSYLACKLFPDAFGAQRLTDMTWKEFFEVSVPCGLVTSGDVGLSNLSMVTMSITFYTMVKSSTPVFVLTWAYLFGIVRITWALVGVVVIIFIGEFLTVAGEVDFVLKGFLLCLMASVLSGARWTLVQLKIQRLDPPLKTTVATMRLLSPMMFASLLVVACAIEQPWNALKEVVDSWDTALYVVKLGLLGAVFAIAMILCEFFLIMYSNAIVLMIGGVLKEILTIFIG